MKFYILETDIVNWTYTQTYHAGTFSAESLEVFSEPLLLSVLRYLKETEE